MTARRAWQLGSLGPDTAGEDPSSLDKPPLPPFLEDSNGQGHVAELTVAGQADCGWWAFCPPCAACLTSSCMDCESLQRLPSPACLLCNGVEMAPTCSLLHFMDGWQPYPRLPDLHPDGPAQAGWAPFPSQAWHGRDREWQAFSGWAAGGGMGLPPAWTWRDTNMTGRQATDREKDCERQGLLNMAVVTGRQTAWRKEGGGMSQRWQHGMVGSLPGGSRGGIYAGLFSMEAGHGN